ncbi:RtcB family protein [Adhaeribacter sp. BT258]|uniref:3'-phosphate/5'-hydroxy nucleic acid ligase n=1 Tax=Adhaeribacter terrigena TaxID=2793070 RepID=A0ABS1C0B4_9BACT|nr:RtcB family protein [Adhaeribacter terrigena]MBK0402607.1 RtcB family protein [Adhaeribacter terrigena]
MGKSHNIKGKDLSKIGFVNDVSRSIAIMLAAKHFKHLPKKDVLKTLSEVQEKPEAFLEHETLAQLARTFVVKTETQTFQAFELKPEGAPVKIYGRKNIEGAAKLQMEQAMRLPVALQGALMPDAHVGFGLPIGGVLAVENAVIPYAVGLDIGCRMALSIFDLPEKYLQTESYHLKKALKENTHFGINGGIAFAQEHEVLDHPDFNATPLLRKLHSKAVYQLGSSGSGNHFVEFGLIELFAGNPVGMPAGTYLALLSHSGSRGMGAAVAKHYTNLAMDACKLPKQAQNLAWLSLDAEAGQEYWLSMQLAGRYAQACHDQIHLNLAKAIGEKPAVKVENHHNFAWQDQLPDGRNVIVHRKGATPAHAGELGIIPGSMTTAGYLVSGKGNPDSLFSASHGAGRRLSRGRARESFTVSAMKKMLASAGVTLIGGSPEECPMAYKDIDTVMQGQTALVDVHGKFMPKIVRMNKE